MTDAPIETDEEREKRERAERHAAIRERARALRQRSDDLRAAR